MFHWFAYRNANKNKQDRKSTLPLYYSDFTIIYLRGAIYIYTDRISMSSIHNGNNLLQPPWILKCSLPLAPGHGFNVAHELLRPRFSMIGCASHECVKKTGASPSYISMHIYISIIFNISICIYIHIQIIQTYIQIYITFITKIK